MKRLRSINPGMNQANNDEKAVNNRSIRMGEYTATMLHTQQKIPPKSIGLKRYIAPVMNVGIPYNMRKYENTYSP